MTVNTDVRNIRTSHYGAISFQAIVLEDVYLDGYEYPEYLDVLKGLKKTYGEGTDVNECPGHESDINHITVFKIPESVSFFDTEIVYRLNNTTTNILQDILDEFNGKDHEIQTTTESQRVAKALGCSSLYPAILHNDHKPITAGTLRNMLNRVCDRYGEDTAVYIDDGSIVRGLYDEIHVYKSECGSRKGLIIIADDKKQ